MLEENRDVHAALRDALIARDELVRDEILEVIEQALVRTLLASAKRSSADPAIDWPHDDRSVIVAGARTPIGKFRGSLAGFQAVDLGGDRDPRRARARRAWPPSRSTT